MSSLIRPEAPIYRMISCLGEGLSSRVFAAIREDSRGFSKQRVVLKILKTETNVHWLKQEFEALSKIRSPNCVGILGWDNLPEGPALVLEHIDGLDLREILAETAFSRDEIESIGSQLQSALSAVHSVGLCHGDLSLSNIMIDKTGTVRLIDFALSTPEITQLVGTPAYMAPEIWDGKKPSATSDLFSAGVILEDLRAGTQQIPKGTAACRARSDKLVGRNSLLYREPDKRRFPEFKERAEVKAQIGMTVSKLIDAKAKNRTQTITLSNFRTQTDTSNLNSSFRLRFASVLAGIVLILPAFANRPVNHKSTRGKQACLEIRSQSWFEIELDGKNFGYAPRKICDLPAGLHILHWRSPLGSGFADIRLQHGEDRFLQGSELKPIR